MKKKRQISLAVVMVIFGMALILAAFIVPPTGYIDPTVLTAFGEMLTFAGAVIGIDYRYKAPSQPPPRRGGEEDPLPASPSMGRRWVEHIE